MDTAQGVVPVQRIGGDAARGDAPAQHLPEFELVGHLLDHRGLARSGGPGDPPSPLTRTLRGGTEQAPELRG